MQKSRNGGEHLAAYQQSRRLCYEHSYTKRGRNTTCIAGTYIAWLQKRIKGNQLRDSRSDLSLVLTESN